MRSPASVLSPEQGLDCPPSPRTSTVLARPRIDNGPDVRRLAAGALAVRLHLIMGAIAIAGYYLVPAVRGEWAVYCAIGISAPVATFVGIRRYRPPIAAAWWLFGAGVAVGLFGDILFFVVGGAFPSVADVLYVASYPLLASGLLLLIRRQSTARDLASLIDAGIVTVGLSLLAWVFLMEPHTHDRGVGLLEQALSVGYPLMDVVLLGAAVHLAMVARSRTPALFMLAGGIVLLLAADTGYGIVELNGGYGDSIYLDWGWLTSHLLLGAAALHPSMALLTRRSEEPQRELGQGRLALLGLVLLLAPAVQAVRDRWSDGGSPVVYAGSAVLSVLVLARMLRLVQDLRQAVDGYQRAERVKNDFIATVSHELRTPLTNILGHVELLGDGSAGPLEPQQLRMLDVVDRNGARLLRMIDDLLTISNDEATRLRSFPVPTALDQLVARAGAAASAEAEQRGITLDADASGDMGTALVDRSQLDRALMYLLSNALKFTPEGGRVTLRGRASSDEFVVTVEDTGMGIPLEDQPFVFDRFFRSPSAQPLAIPGAGLGLSIVKAIADAHNGSIVLESEQGSGTTATLRIPMGRPDGGSRCARKPPLG